jgi:flagellar hook-associated protein 2
VNDVVPGLNFTLLQKPADNTKTVNLTMATDPNQISGAISAFVTAYNSMVDTVQAQEGRTAGLLSGDYAVRETQQDLQALTTYAGAGTIKSLADMGITFEDASGHLTFNTATFANLSSSQLQGAMAFFGSPTTGFGALAQKFTALTDPVSGVFTLESAGFSQSDKSLQAQIATLTDRANAMQTALSRQLALADTLIAGLQSQQNMLTSSISSLSYVLYGKPTSSASS